MAAGASASVSRCCPIRPWLPRPKRLGYYRKVYAAKPAWQGLQAAGQGMAPADRQPGRLNRDTVPGESARNVSIVGVSSKLT